MLSGQALRNHLDKDGILLYYDVVCIILVFYYSKTEKESITIALQKKELDEKNEIISEKNREITDSIQYALRLQQAILPSLSQINRHFNNSFVLYRPKDIVAGDFYWMHTTDKSVLIAACDCTGHGVPGALVSIVCSNALNRTVNEFQLTDTGQILDKVTELVLETFAKSGEEIKDGMDISLLSIDKTSGKIQWSGANNPLWIVKGAEFTEIKANKQPIGKSEGRTPFTAHNLLLNHGETYYLITDGYADQFGKEDKKLMKKKFKELILSIQDKTMEEQRKFLDEHHTNWKGGTEQTDDVTVIGIRV
jgi:serine phosphatase RsbU (regulator of sigma subunit)